MAGENVWVKLPIIIIVEILSYLSLTDILNATKTCKRWRSCLFHPPLWRSINFKVENGSRSRSKHLADMCGRFVRNVVIDFNSSSSENVKDCLHILHVLMDNTNLERLALRPTSCQLAQIGWPEPNTIDTCANRLVRILQNCRSLRHISLGCLEGLGSYVPTLVSLLVSRHADTLRALHLATVREDPNADYVPPALPPLGYFRQLQELGLDFEYLSADLLSAFHSALGGGTVAASSSTTQLRRLVIHVHGSSATTRDVSIPNDVWRHLVCANPRLEVTVSMLHCSVSASWLLRLLRPSLPLAHLRLYFCERLHASVVNYVGRILSGRLRSLQVIDAMPEMWPNLMRVSVQQQQPGAIPDEDPFVMLAWRATCLSHLTIIGYEVNADDLIAIARLRGPLLKTFDIPLCCITNVDDDDEDDIEDRDPQYGIVGEEFNSEISRWLGREWKPLTDDRLHLAVKDVGADAERTYLSVLQQDQAW